MLRGAISGFGEVAARAHLIGWSARRDAQIVAVHDAVAARRHQAINLIRNIRVYDDLDLMLDAERLDFVDIASPPRYHAATARAALLAGAHVLVEKPLCLDQKEFAELRQAAAAASRVLMCVHNWKQSPAYRRAYELIAAGRIGKVERMSISRLRTGPAGAGGSAVESGERWRLDPASGGGILIDHGWHVFYLMQWLMEGNRPEAIAARLQFAAGNRIDEAADLAIQFPTAAASAQLSWRSANRATTAEIVGDRAALTIDENRLTLRSRAGEVEDCSVVDAADDSYHAGWFAGMAEEFVRAIAEGNRGVTTTRNLAEAEAAAALIIGARESDAQGGRPVRLRFGEG